MNLIEKLHQIEDIHQLAEEISDYFQAAIVIENHHFELIAYGSPEGYLYDPIQQKTILAKHCPLYVLERLKKEGIIDRLSKEDTPIRIDRMEDINFYERIVISLKIRGVIYGYLWLYETDLLTEDVFSILSEIAPHLSKCLFRMSKAKQDKQQTLIWNLLNDEYLNEAEIHREAKKIGFRIPEKFTIIAYVVRDASFTKVLDKIKYSFTKNGYDSYLGKPSEIIGIIHGDEEAVSHLRTEIIAELSSEEREALFVGIGQTYENVSLMRKSYVESLEVIETMAFLNIQNQQITQFNELGIYRYMKMMYKKNTSEQYRNASLVKLIAADKMNKSELLKTLWLYLDNDCKLGKAAEALYIHPNTMNYRLKQITELVQIDFSNIKIKIELYNELWMMHHIPDYHGHYYRFNNIHSH